MGGSPLFVLLYVVALRRIPPELFEAARMEGVGPLRVWWSIVEMAGDQIFLELDASGALLVARAEPDFEAAHGDRLRIWFDTEALHLFDPRTGAALASEDAV